MNKKIIIAVLVVAASGVTRSWQKQQPITPVIIGAYVLLLVLSILDMFGGPISDLANALAMLAATYVLLTEFPWQSLISLVQGKKGK